MLGGIEIITGHGVGSKGIWLGTVFGKLLQGVAVLGVKHLMLQIVSNARRGIQPPAVQLKAQVHAAVVGGKEGIFAGVAGFTNDTDRQAVGQSLPHGGLTDAAVFHLFHSSASFPRRKYTVSS